MEPSIKLKLGLVLLFSFLHTALSQQFAPNMLKPKVDEIAKAYAEGYKAAINAFRARSLIPRKKLIAKLASRVNPKSFIPKPVATQIRNQFVMSNRFGFPGSPLTVNGVEKSGIPRPLPQARFLGPAASANALNSAHNVVVRSAAPPPLLGKFMLQQTNELTPQQMQQRSAIPAAANTQANQNVNLAGSKVAETARLNAAARHRNVYFDSMGGDPYGSASAVLSRQTIHLNRNRRSLHRARRSRMPYLGQDLDKIGVVRAIPVMKGVDHSKTNALPAFMKVHSAEFGSAVRQTDNMPSTVTAEKKYNILAYQQQPQLAMQYVQQRSYMPAAPKLAANPQNNKRDMIASMNQAARHRNVYLDSIGGNPYGSSSGVLSRQQFMLSKHKRNSEKNY